MTKTDTIDFKDWAGALDNWYYLTKHPKQNESLILRPQEVDEFNEKWYDIYLPANVINGQKLRIKNMVWKFSFKNKNQKSSIKRDITKKDYRMSQFKNNKKIKDSFKKALGRSRWRYRQLAVIISGLDVYIVLCLRENKVQYLKEEWYNNYWESVYNDLEIVLETKKNKSIRLLKNNPEDNDVFSGPLSMGLPAEPYYYWPENNREQVVVAKNPNWTLNLASFERAYKKKINKQVQRWTNKNSEPIDFPTKKAFNCARDRQKVLAGKAAYKEKLKKFREKYQEQLLINGKLGAQRWLAQSFNTFINLKGYLLAEYWLETANIKAQAKRYQQYDDVDNTESKQTKLIVKDQKNKKSYSINGLVYNNKKIKSKIEKKVLNPAQIFKDYIIHPELKRFGLRRQKFLDYWNKNPDVLYSLLNIWLRDGLWISFNKKETEKEKERGKNNYASIESKEIVEEKSKNKKGLAKQLDNWKLSEINTNDIPSNWSNFVDLFRGGQIAQEEFFEKNNIDKQEIIKKGGMEDCLIFSLDGISQVLKGKKLKQYHRLISTFNSASMLHKITKKKGIVVQNIKLLEFFIVGNKDVFSLHLKDWLLPNSFKTIIPKLKNKEYWCIKVADDFHNKSRAWTHSVVSITTKDFLRLSDTTKNIGYLLLGRAKKYQALPSKKSKKWFGWYWYSIGSEKEMISCDLDYIRGKLGVSNSVIKRSLKELENIGLLSNYINSRKKNKIQYRISKKYLY